MIRGGVNVVGKKGRSGRKSANYEYLKREVIEKAWNKINKELDNKDVKDVALPIALKDMVAKIGNPDGSSIKPIQIYGGKSLETLPEYTSNGKDILIEEEN